MTRPDNAGYVFDPPPRASVAVVGEASRFPVRRIFCVGRNYAAHAREMGADPEREPPFFFSKPADAVFDAGQGLEATMPYPPCTENLHHEVELAVAIGRGGAGIRPAEASGHIFGYAVALDMTRRDLQSAAKRNGRPWDLAKGFDHSAPMGPMHPADRCGEMSSGRIWLSVDGEVRQAGDLCELIWPVPDVIAALSEAVALEPGDLILTGTPAGVGPVQPGQTVRAGIDGLTEIAVRIVGGA